MGLGKKHRVELDIKKYMHLIIGDKKVGKTGLTADLAKEIYGDIEKLLIVSIGKEKAYEAIHGAIYEEPQDWTELMEIVDALVENKDKYKFDMVSFDTIDEIIPMAEEEVIRLHTVAYKEVPKSFNACFGSYGAPRAKLSELINEMLSKLDTITDITGVYFIGHNKVRPMKTKLDTEDYYVVSSNLSFDYFNIFAYKCPIICNIVKEVGTVDTGKEEGVGKEKRDILVADKRDRFMYLRDSGAVEAGGRFKGMPEKVAYGARNYHDAIIEGIKASIDDGGSTKDVPSFLDDQPKKEKKEQPKPTPKKPKVEEVQPELTLEATIKNAMDLAKTKQTSGVLQNEIMSIFNNAGYPNPNNIPSVDIANKIIEELKKLG